MGEARGVGVLGAGSVVGRVKRGCTAMVSKDRNLEGVFGPASVRLGGTD
jgi:hypothetical protein